jgi:O-antigen/teichoic acid export membrane protein
MASRPRKSYDDRLPIMKRLNVDLREVIAKSGAAFTLRVTGAGLGFVFNVVLARMLGAQGAGIYYLALAITGIGALASTVGIPDALLRFIAAHATHGEWDKVSGAYRKGIKISTAAAVACTALLMACAPWLSRDVFGDPDLAGPLRIMVLAVLPMSLITLHGMALKSLKRVLTGTLLEGFGISLLSLPLLLVLGGSMGIDGAALAYVVAAFVVFIVGVRFWRQATPHLKGLRGEFETRRLLITSVPMLWIDAMDVALHQTGILLLGVWASAEDVGVYGAVGRLVAVMTLVFIVTKSVVGPRFAELHARGEEEAIGVLARDTSKFLTLFAVPVVLPLIVLPQLVLSIFGPGFAAGGTALAIVSAGQLVRVALSPSGYVLMMTGHEKLMRNTVVVCGALNVALSTWLIPEYGMNGAAVSTGIAFALTSIVATVLVRWKLSIVALPIPRWFYDRTG